MWNNEGAEKKWSKQVAKVGGYNEKVAKIVKHTNKGIIIKR